MTLNAEPRGLALDVVCTPRPSSPVREMRLRFESVSGFDLNWSSDYVFYLVSGYKAFDKDSGEIYVSTDPCDDRETAPDPGDGGVIEARTISAVFAMKS